MNQIVTQPDSRVLAIEEKINRDVSSAITVGSGGITFQNAGEVMEYAKMMAVSGSAVPKHLRGQPGACLGIIDDAIRFQTSPYALARKSFFVNDNLAYEAQVIAGIINRFAPLKERPDVRFEGDGPDRKCSVTFKFRDGSERTYESPAFKNIKPKNSPLWQNDPDQQHSYYSLRAGARRYCPEIILGMFDVDEMRPAIDHRDVEERPSLQDRLAAAKGEASSSEGFSREFVASETAALTDAPNIQTQEPSAATASGEVDGTPSVDTGGGGPFDSSAAPTDSAEEAETPEAGENTGRVTTKQTAPVSGGNRAECIDKMLTLAVDDRVNEEDRIQALAERADDWAEDVGRDFATAVYKTARQVIRGEVTVPDAKKYLEAVR